MKWNHLWLSSIRRLVTRVQFLPPANRASFFILFFLLILISILKYADDPQMARCLDCLVPMSGMPLDHNWRAFVSVFVNQKAKRPRRANCQVPRLICPQIHRSSRIVLYVSIYSYCSLLQIDSAHAHRDVNDAIGCAVCSAVPLSCAH